MRISIAMCTYNGAQYLQRQLDGFSTQTLPPYELIVCDDGSTDGTIELINRFKNEVPFPVTLITNSQNIGSTKNFEQAISLCQGDLIALSDQDDEWPANKLADFASLFETIPHALAAFSNADLIDSDSAPLGRSLWEGVYFSPSSQSPHLDPRILDAFSS